VFYNYDFIQTFKTVSLLPAQATSGEHAKASSKAVDRMHSVDIDPLPVGLLHRIRRANAHDRRMLQRSASGYHGNHRHGNQQRRAGIAHPLQTALAHHAVVRRKRIRRNETTPAVTSTQAPAVEQALVFHPSARHWRPSAKLPRKKSKPNPAEHAGKTGRRKLARRRGREHSPPVHLFGLDSKRWRYSDRAKDRRTWKPIKGRDGGNKTLTFAHYHKQNARDQRRRVSGHHLHRPGLRQIKEAAFSLPAKHQISAYSLPDSIMDETKSHPVFVHHFGISPRRRAPVSGSGERRRRVSVVRKSEAGGLHHADDGDGVSLPMKHVIPALHRHHIGQRIQSSDG